MSSDERLSAKLEEASRMVLVPPLVWADAIEHALRIEAGIDTWPKRRSEDPDTSYYEGSISDLRESQQAVLAIFDSTDEPLDDPEMIARYRAYQMPPQSESGLRTRRRELCRLGILTHVDREGTSPTGRPAARYERANP